MLKQRDAARHVVMLVQELTKDLDFDESAADAELIARKEAALEELADWVRCCVSRDSTRCSML